MNKESAGSNNLNNDIINTKQKTFKMSKIMFVFEVTLVALTCIFFIAITEISIFTIFSIFTISVIIVIALIFRYIFTSITVSDIGMDYKKGWLFTTKKQIPYDNINTVDLYVSILGKIFEYGNIHLSTGNDVTGIWFKTIDQPEILRELIEIEIAKNSQSQNSTSNADDNQLDDVDDLEKLAELKQKGIITEEEFAAKKKQILGL